jgi:hypothetical protein
MYFKCFYKVRDRCLVNLSRCEYLVFWQPLVKHTVFPLHCLAPLSKIRLLQLCGFISETSFLFHWVTCLFWCQYMLFLLLCLCCITSNQLLYVILPKLLVLDRIFYISREISELIFLFVRNDIGILTDVLLNIDLCRNITISTILILLISEHWDSFRSLMSSSISFFKVLWFSCRSL